MVPRNESFVSILLLPLFLLLFLLESRLILCSLNEEEHLITNLTASKIHSSFSSEKTSNFSSTLDPSLSSSTTPSPESLLKEPSESNISTFSNTDSKTKQHLHTLDEQGRFVFFIFPPSLLSLSFFSTFLSSLFPFSSFSALQMLSTLFSLLFHSVKCANFSKLLYCLPPPLSCF